MDSEIEVERDKKRGRAIEIESERESERERVRERQSQLQQDPISSVQSLSFSLMRYSLWLSELMCYVVSRDRVVGSSRAR